MCPTLTIYPDNSMFFRVTGVKPLGGSYVEDATAQVTLTDDDGNQLSGQAWPLALDFVADSDGDYQGVLQSDLVLPTFGGVLAQVTVTATIDSLPYAAASTEIVEIVTRREAA